MPLMVSFFSMHGHLLCTIAPGREVLSLAELEISEGPFEAMIVTAGAAIGSILEVGPLLPLQLCQVRLFVTSVLVGLWRVVGKAMHCVASIIR